MITKNIGSLQCIGTIENRPRLNYLLTPIGLSVSDIAALAEQYDSDLVVIGGMDWDDDLTPWAAPGVPRSCPPFKGLASDFLRIIKQQIIPAFESRRPPVRNLMGISLSGLFTLWAWMQDDTFDNIGSVSGSFWYHGFVEWLTVNAVHKTGQAYFSLGDKEGGRGGDPAFRDIHHQTQQVIDILTAKSIRCTFQQTQGNHYAQPQQRLHLMLKAIADV